MILPILLLLIAGNLLIAAGYYEGHDTAEIVMAGLLIGSAFAQIKHYFEKK